MDEEVFMCSRSSVVDLLRHSSITGGGPKPPCSSGGSNFARVEPNWSGRAYLIADPAEPLELLSPKLLRFKVPANLTLPVHLSEGRCDIVYLNLTFPRASHLGKKTATTSSHCRASVLLILRKGLRIPIFRPSEPNLVGAPLPPHDLPRWRQRAPSRSGSSRTT